MTTKYLRYIVSFVILSALALCARLPPRPPTKMKPPAPLILSQKKPIRRSRPSQQAAGRPASFASSSLPIAFPIPFSPARM